MIYNHFDKAIRAVKRYLPLSLIALLPFMTACQEYDENFSLDTVPVTLYLQTSNAHHTRAYIGDVAAVDNESTIYTVKVWFFTPGAGTDALAVAYSDDLVVESNVNKVTINVPRALAQSTVDAYIIANAESVGLGGLIKTTPLGTIKTAVLAGEYFTPAAKTDAVPTTGTAKGLPMSRIEKGLDLRTLREVGVTTPDLKTIKLTRAVSKIRFAFARPKGHIGEILGIQVDGSLIASNEYILPVEPSTENAEDYRNSYQGDLHANIGTGYESNALVYGTVGLTVGTPAPEGTDPLFTNTDISEAYDAENLALDASSYAWENWLEANADEADKAGAYNTLMNTYTKKTVYLRESDKQLTGTIYYRLTPTGNVQSQSFTMNATQDFARNHVWIVYAYFEDGKLWVKPIKIADWIDTDELTYTMDVTTNMRLFDSWLYRFDTDGIFGTVTPLNPEVPKSYNHWAGSHMVVSDGLQVAGVTGDVENRPLNSPQIQLVTSGSGEFHMVIDNDNFQFVKATKVDGLITQCDIYDGELTIPAGTDVHTYFYVIPKPGVNWDAEGVNYAGHITMYYDDPVLGTYKVPFNYSALPGYSDDSSEFWVYYFPVDEYNNTNGNKMKMYYQDVNHPLVPTANQD